MPSTAEVVRQTGRIIRERPVLNPRNAREPVNGDIRSPATRVCFLLATDAGPLSDNPDFDAYHAITNEIRATSPEDTGFVDYFERWGAEASGQLCDHVADQLEADRA